MIYKMDSVDNDNPLNLQITYWGKKMRFYIEDPEDIQAGALVMISTNDFIQFLKCISTTNEIEGIKLSVTDDVTDEANNV